MIRALPWLALLLCACGQSASTAVDAAPVDDLAAPADLVALPPDVGPWPFTPVPSTTMVLTQTLSVGDRQVVLLVPAFAYDRAKAWLLLINDGQDINALGLALTLDGLWKKQMLPPMVVAALPVSPGGDRLQDYGTAEHDVAIACDTGDSGTPLLGTRAGAYGLYVIHQAIPLVAHAAGISPAVARTGFLGASLGGLSAFSIAWDHPEVFGFAGAMSGSFWWRTMSGSVADRQNSRIMQNIVARSASHPGFGAWFEAGTSDETADRDGDGIIDAIDDTLDLMAALQTRGLAPGTDLVYDQIQGGIHGYPTWAGALPAFLAWTAGR